MKLPRNKRQLAIRDDHYHHDHSHCEPEDMSGEWTSLPSSTFVDMGWVFGGICSANLLISIMSNSHLCQRSTLILAMTTNAKNKCKKKILDEITTNTPVYTHHTHILVNLSVL